VPPPKSYMDAVIFQRVLDQGVRGEVPQKLKQNVFFFINFNVIGGSVLIMAVNFQDFGAIHLSLPKCGAR